MIGSTGPDNEIGPVANNTKIVAEVQKVDEKESGENPRSEAHCQFWKNIFI